ncbi:hypothetical protein BIY27_19730 [Gibbsiella quercinecans]|nr:hypothetical protein BIY27_19730 [Gibbsiella quercinecans]
MEQHDYQLYLAINNIDHTKTKAMSPQTNGICERFHKTILQEFYQVTFRRSYMQTWKACKWIWTTGCGITIMSELIRGKCAVAGRQWKHYLY